MLLGIIQEIRGAAGLVAFIGLVPLSALFFSQARDIKRLREWAGRAPERSARGVTPVPKRARFQPWCSRIGTRPVVVALAGLLVLGGAATYGVTQLIGDDGGDNSANAHANHGAAVKPGNVTVAVLNGTTVPGLAAALGHQIAAAGFKEGHDRCLLRPGARRVSSSVRAGTPSRSERGEPQSRNQPA